MRGFFLAFFKILLGAIAGVSVVFLAAPVAVLFILHEIGAFVLRKFRARSRRMKAKLSQGQP